MSIFKINAKKSRLNIGELDSEEEQPVKRPAWQDKSIEAK